ncbi:MAG: DUF484 family protein [Gammaproteobacteria bacterium]|nr:DUF484 family protein [Gammaproteobacteria bacterium]
MTTQLLGSSPNITALSAEQVELYLREHPEFFNDHLPLVASLRIPHAAGPAVSLIERQVAVLRDQNQQYKRKLMELVQVGRDNDALHRNLHLLTLALMRANSLGDVVERVHGHLRDDFKADVVALRLARLPKDFSTDTCTLPLDASDAALASFAPFFRAVRPLCGELKAEQLAFLYGDQAEAVASTALIPLGVEAELGMLAIGSHDDHRFHPAMDTLFLRCLGELIVCAMAPYLDTTTTA